MKAINLKQEKLFFSWNKSVFISINVFVFMLISIASSLYSANSPNEYKEIKVVCDDNYPPFVFRDKDKNIQGILVEQWREWEKVTGVKVHIEATDWDKAKSIMAEGESDVIDTIFYSDERSKLYDFTKPYVSLDVPVFYNKNISGIAKIADLSGFTIGAKRGDACIDILKTNGITSIIEYNNYESIIQDAAAGKLKLFCVDKPPALYYIYKYNLENDYHYSLNLYTGQFHRAVKKGDKGLLQLVESGFTSIDPDVMKKINNKWLGYTLEKKISYKLFLIVILSILFFSINLVFLIYLLRKRVQSKTAELKDNVCKLEASEEQNKALISTIPDLLFLLDKDGVFLKFNAPDKSMVAVDPDKIIGKKFNDMPFSDEYKEMCNKASREAVKNNEIRTIEYELSVPAGIRSFEARVCPYGSNNVLWICRDITDKKIAEEEISDTRNYLKTILDSITTNFITINSKGAITQVNLAAEKFLGRSSENIYGIGISELLPFIKENYNKIENVIESQKHDEFFLSLQKGLSKQYLKIGVFPLLFKNTSGAVIRIDDETNSIKKDEQLLQAQKMDTVGTLAGGLAHDFNNVLGGIIGTTSLMKFAIENNKYKIDKIVHDISSIESIARRGADIVSHLLSLSRKQEITAIPLNLNNSITNVIKLCANTFDKSIEIQSLLPDEDSIINGDPAQIEQVLLNIFVNANHAMTVMRSAGEMQGGILSISVCRQKCDSTFRIKHPEAEDVEYWVVDIQDTGIGMSDEVMLKMFDPFFTTKEKFDGTGLGLTMVYNIIHQHHGFIDVYSEVGKGTIFKLYFPVTTCRLNIEKPNEEYDHVLTGHGKILVVDDEEIIRNTAKEILENCGYEVLLAPDGEIGIKLFKENDDIEVVLLDMSMPKLSGKETLIELKKIRSSIKVLMASGFKDDVRMKECFEFGIAGFIQKPYSMNELAKKIFNIMP